ncbi:hypothetical protein B7P43_G05135 [Cryptotermes secundus]|uniref:Uncharacterized protein n=1 Tax=Cryptotermes secundus TaxID=105785 RepID=A0A2J7PEY2_9NEOP|nr:hypothetical protein B7P43_G05135 [Cryptotermes secundus]
METTERIRNLKSSLNAITVTKLRITGWEVNIACMVQIRHISLYIRKQKREKALVPSLLSPRYTLMGDRFVCERILGGSSICCLTLQHRYRTPVPIPANAEVHFKTLNTIDGSYHFGYDTGLMRYQSFREEVRDPTGRIKGKFGFIDPRGLLRITEYTADKLGYRKQVSYISRHFAKTGHATAQAVIRQLPTAVARA